MPTLEPMATELNHVQIFEAYCPQCRKVRNVHIKEGIAGNKDFDVLTCICGNSIPVDVLKYLYRDMENLDGQIYFLY